MFELEDHLMDCGRGDLEETPEVGLGRWAFVEQGVGMDERQVLALLFGELWRQTGHRIGEMIKALHEHTLSRHADHRGT